MRIVNKQEMAELPRGTVFAEISTPNHAIGDFIEQLQWMVKDDYEFGATYVLPGTYQEEELFDFDWSINEFNSNDHFMIMEEQDILRTIKVLIRGIGGDND